jgi:hydroxymethylpyrimidine/phosphomethylpyrimidine kinase
MYTNILVIAGSDSSGGAGIQADIKTINNLGCHATTAITAVTSQNSKTVKHIYPIPPQIIKEQIEAICSDIAIDVVKIGMVYDIKSYQAIFSAIKTNIPKVKIILDPVFISSTHKNLVELNTEFLRYIKEEVLAQIYLLTPNLNEANLLLSDTINDLDSMQEAVKLLCKIGDFSVLLKGGHLNGNKIYDILCHKNEIKIFTNDKIIGNDSHGSGCSLASAISAYLARGYKLEEAVAKARKYVYEAIEKSINPGQGIGFLNHIEYLKLEN